MSNFLNSEDFGLKIYNKFPPKYREDDTSNGFALKRYIQALSDGGFKYTIEEINGITELIDATKVDSKVLPLLFKQYGLEVFNGIPEQYLRYLLPRLGEAWSKKGSLDAIEFITSSLSGIKTTTSVEYSESGDPTIEVRLEMDYNMGDYFPDAGHFSRIIENFIPFYCDSELIYSYLFYENPKLIRKEEVSFLNITDTKYENAGFYSLVKEGNSSLLGEAVLGLSVLGERNGQVESFEDSIVEVKTETSGLLHHLDTLTNRSYNTLNGKFFTNGVYCFDKITVGDKTEILYY